MRFRPKTQTFVELTILEPPVLLCQCRLVPDAIYYNQLQNLDRTVPIETGSKSFLLLSASYR